jgi:hypothetical protein
MLAAKAPAMKVPAVHLGRGRGRPPAPFARMDGTFAMSMQTSLVKAKTAACYGEPTGEILAGVDIELAIATQGERVNLPVIIDGAAWSGQSASAPAPASRTARWPSRPEGRPRR